MIAYVISRFLQAIPVLFIASVAVFLVLRLVPGDPAVRLAGEDASPERVAEIRDQLGISDPLVVQYLDWVKELGQGDLGESFASGLPITRLLSIALPPTVELAVASYVVALLVGIPLGCIAGVRVRSGWDWGLSIFTVGTLGIPNFMLGILLLWGFSVHLGWFPAAGRVAFTDDPASAVRYLALPALALGSGLAAVLARYTRTAVQETMAQDYVRTARAKGLSEPLVVIRHALRNALVPVTTIVALQVGQILAGAVVIERVFTRPGLGRLIVDAIQNRDYLVVQSTLIILVLVFVTVNLFADVAYGLLDPRIRRR